jgi:hypothetical protein
MQHVLGMVVVWPRVVALAFHPGLASHVLRALRASTETCAISHVLNQHVLDLDAVLPRMVNASVSITDQD